MIAQAGSKGQSKYVFVKEKHLAHFTDQRPGLSLTYLTYLVKTWSLQLYFSGLDHFAPLQASLQSVKPIFSKMYI